MPRKTWFPRMPNFTFFSRTCLWGLCLAPLFPASVLAQSGSVDATFDPGTGTDLAVYSVALQTNGQIIIGGEFTSFNDVERINVARLTATGARDDGFNPMAAFGGGFPFVNAVVLQSGTNVLCGGSFGTSAGATNFARLNSNGSLDSTFNPIADDTVNAIAIQTDGSVLIGGFFTHVNHQPRTGIARLNANGMLDPAFNPSLSGAFAGVGVVTAMAVQSDGKIIIGGTFTNVNATATTNIARLNTDGTLDTGFKPVSMNGGSLAPTVPGAVNAVAIDTQGRVVVGGDFTTINGLVRNNLERFNSDGSLDPTFNPAAGTDFAINSVALELYGKILIGGNFNSVNGTTNNYIARLTDNGSLDTSFNTGLGASDAVYSVVLQPDGKVLLGGAFAEFNGMTNSSGITRLENVQTVSPPVLFNPRFTNNIFRVSVSTYTGKSYVLQYKNAVSDSTWTALPGIPGDGTVKTLTDAAATVARRFYQVVVQ